jgi:hypothetical protein
MELLTSERRTKGTDSSSWPTPQAVDSKLHLTQHDQVYQNKSGNWRKVNNQGNVSSCNLARTAALESLWRTPIVYDAANRTNSRPQDMNRSLGKDMRELMEEAWHTPVANDAVHPHSTVWTRMTNSLQGDLSRMNWNTPRANDSKQGAKTVSMGTRDQLAGDTMRLEHSAALNPDWVETLMGYNVGWTSLPTDWRSKYGLRGRGRPRKAGNLQG